MPDSPSPPSDPFAALDRAAVARTLSQLADRRGDLADAWFERVEEVELPPEEASGWGQDRGGPGVRVRREEGLAVRLVRDGQTWLSARDGIASAGFADALRQVARVLPAAAYPEPVLDLPAWDEPFEAPEVLELPSLVHRAVRARHAAFALRLTVRRHRRWVQVVGGERLVPDAERESFYSCEAELPWCRWGALFPHLGRATAERIAEALVDLFRARHAGPPEPFRGTVVLAPAAAAVLLHEAVAHALEADLLALGGNPEAAVGVVLGPSCLSVLDDPAGAPEPVRRATDDEGRPVRRRWLLREGVVQEPLADGLWAAASEVLTPGAGRRAGRHALPGPRSTHLELLAGDLAAADLAADAEGGLWFTEAGRGALDPLTGTFRLELPSGRRIRGGVPGDPVGPCRIEGRVADLLASVAGVGDVPEPAGAGWCAKGGSKLPVWATCPALRLEGVEVLP